MMNRLTLRPAWLCVPLLVCLRCRGSRQDTDPPRRSRSPRMVETGYFQAADFDETAYAAGTYINNCTRMMPSTQLFDVLFNLYSRPSTITDFTIVPSADADFSSRWLEIISWSLMGSNQRSGVLLRLSRTSSCCSNDMCIGLSVM